MGKSKSTFKKEVYSDTILPQETRKISNKQPTCTPKATREKEQTKPKVSRKKEIVNIRTQINEIEMKKPIEKITETKSYFIEKINKIDKPIARLNKIKRERTQGNKIR